jgi:DNA-binding MarR family transcriptional regulator
VQETETGRVQSLRQILRKLERVQKTQLVDQDSCCGLPFALCHPLLEIGKLGRATTVELAQRLELDKSTLSRSVDGLVRKGLVRRRTDTRDRRFTQLTLTTEGERVCREIDEKANRHYQEVLQRIPMEEQVEMLRRFGELVEAMAAQVIGSECNRRSIRMEEQSCSGSTKPSH